MNVDNPICICGHTRTEHDDQPNPKCLAQEVCDQDCRPWCCGTPRVPCDCPGFEADPKANGDNE